MAKITLYQGGAVTVDVNTENSVEDALVDAKKMIEEKLAEVREENRRKKNCPIWEELEKVSGCCISLCSETGDYGTWRAIEGNQNIFINEQHAKSALAMAKISQLMPYYGGRITADEWNDAGLEKYAISRIGCDLDRYRAYSCYNFVAFRTKENRDRFLSRKENVRLIKDYFMID